MGVADIAGHTITSKVRTFETVLSDHRNRATSSSPPDSTSATAVNSTQSLITGALSQCNKYIIHLLSPINVRKSDSTRAPAWRGVYSSNTAQTDSSTIGIGRKWKPLQLRDDIENALLGCRLRRAAQQRPETYLRIVHARQHTCSHPGKDGYHLCIFV
jgi:hypothetical protein